RRPLAPRRQARALCRLHRGYSGIRRSRALLMNQPSPHVPSARDAGWRQAFASKITSAAGAIAQIRPGRRILSGSGAAEPVRLVEALARDGHHLADNEVVHLLTLGPAPYTRP